MPLNQITFIPGEGGLGRPLLGGDHISGLVYFASALPSGFSADTRIKKIFSPAQAIALGIKNDYSDETKATGTFTVTNVGANGDPLEMIFTEPNGTAVSLGIYIKAATETTVTLVAAAYVAIVNRGTLQHGYTASNAAGVITITARKGLGIFPNSGTPFAKNTPGTLAGTLVQMSGGVYSKLATYYYHISEFFRIQPKGVLYVGFFAVPGTYTFTELETIRRFSNGTIRQCGVWKDGAAFTTANIVTLQSVAATFLQYKTTMSVLYAADLIGVTDLGTLTDTTLLSSNYVTPVIGQDGGGQGFALFKAAGRSITTLGASLGAVALSKVSESIAWVGKFNMSNGIELDTLAFANGQKYDDLDITLITSLSDYGYLFIRKFDDFVGSIHVAPRTATSTTSDYSFIYNNRVIGKAIRGINASLLPDLSSPLTLNSDGTLQDTTVEHFKGLVETNLDQMVRDGELSDYSRDIDPTQNVLSTNKLIISVGLLPKGVADFIDVPISFVKSV